MFRFNFQNVSLTLTSWEASAIDHPNTFLWKLLVDES